jgi:thiamine-monophosphate kinase
MKITNRDSGIADSLERPLEPNKQKIGGATNSSASAISRCKILQVHRALSLPEHPFILFRMMRTRSGKLGELALIEQIRRTFSPPAGANRGPVALGIGDDCAILRPPRGSEILVTTDFSLENRHFRRDLHPAVSAGHRCLARGLSDLAAMGAKPMAAFLSLALPSELLKSAKGRRWTSEFFSGMDSLARQYDTPLAGGDTSESSGGLILADIILIGSAPIGRSLRRSGACPGNFLYVTGSLGGADAELKALLHSGRRSRAKASGDHPHFFPQPRLGVGSALLRRRLATAAIDLSDGLSTDLTHLCRASQVRAEIDAAVLPLHPLAAQLPPDEALHAALNGGEDYELLFSARPGTRVPASIAGVPITRIGTLHPQTGRRPLISLCDSDGKMTEVKPAGWEHFNS